MRALFFGILFLAAAGLMAAMVVGVTVKMVIVFVAMAVIVAGLLYVAGKVYGPPSHLPGDSADFNHAKR